MIVLVIVLIGVAVAVASLVRDLQRRSSPLAALWRLPFMAVLLSAPIVLEDASCTGCTSQSGSKDQTPRSGIVVTAGFGDSFEDGGKIAWCMDWCVNIPDRFVYDLVLTNGVGYQTSFRPSASVAIVQHYRNVLPHKGAVSSTKVDALVGKDVRELFRVYVAADELTLLRRNKNSAADQQEIRKEIQALITERKLPLLVEYVW